jgi:hypothetical protein
LPSKHVKKCFGMRFFKLACSFLKNGMCKHCLVVVFHILRCLHFVSVLQDFLCLSLHLPIARPPIHMFCHRKIVLDARGWQNKQKNLKKLFISVGNVKCCELFHIVFVPNNHVPFGGEQSMFRLPHISWWVYGI